MTIWLWQNKLEIINFKLLISMLSSLICNSLGSFSTSLWMQSRLPHLVAIYKGDSSSQTFTLLGRIGTPSFSNKSSTLTWLNSQASCTGLFCQYIFALITICHKSASVNKGKHSSHKRSKINLIRLKHCQIIHQQNEKQEGQYGPVLLTWVSKYHQEKHSNKAVWWLDAICNSEVFTTFFMT